MIPSTQTTAPIGPASGPFAPEWCDARGAKAIFGLSRSFLYQLIADGKIKSACIRRKGSLRGRRIFSCESIRALLNANTDSVGDKRNQEPGCLHNAQISQNPNSVTNPGVSKRPAQGLSEVESQIQAIRAENERMSKQLAAIKQQQRH